ncbi:MAG: hypothetical protein ACXU8N_14890 [Telluria sp.]
MRGRPGEAAALPLKNKANNKSIVNIFCVTGVTGTKLSAISAVLAEAGAVPAGPSRQDPAFTFETWHDKVVRTPRPVESGTTGRLWEQLAAGLFLTQLDTPAWHWADSRSVWALDFWQGFEQQIRFVLVYVAPRDALATALCEETQKHFDPQQSLAAWEASTRQLLRFYLRHRDRAILVQYADVLQDPAWMIGEINQRWSCGLTAPAGAAAVPALPPLALHLAEEGLRSEPHLRELHEEVCAALVARGNAAPAGADTGFGRVVEDYLAVLHRAEGSGRLEQALAEHGAHLADLSARLALAERAGVDAASQRDGLAAQLEAEREAAQLALARLAAEEQAKTADWAARLETEQARMSELAAKLGEFGPEQKRRATALRTKLEQALKEKDRQLAAAARQSAALHAQAETLLHQLHAAHQEWERHAGLHEQAAQQVQVLQGRWDRMLAMHPDYADYTRLELMEESGRGERTVWLAHGLTVAGQTFDELRIVVHSKPGRHGLEVIHPDGSQGDLRPLARLSARDWDLAQALINALKSALHRPSGEAPVGRTVRTKVWSTLQGLTAEASSLANLARFDQVELRSEQVNPDYEHLWFTLHNFAFGQQRLDRFDFRLACANVTPKRFGTHPKLEFPALTGSALFENWFAESLDDFGEKLELRFALPDGMDLEVWKKLSSHDHAALLGLAAALPAILDRLPRTQLRRPVSAWRDLAVNILRTLLVRVGEAAEVTA